jgi:tetratricopeptide (TPR) repeat protein
VDELARRFKSQFDAESSLLYILARAYAEQSQKELAEETAARALRLYPGKEPEQLSRHIIMARILCQWGLFSWARREFEYVIAYGDVKDPAIRDTRFWLAEMLHDQGDDLDAATNLEELMRVVDRLKAHAPEIEVNTLGPEELRAHMNYFFACHWEAKNDMAKHREYLDKALASSDEDVDVLIACYRLPDQPAGYHLKIVNLIKKTVAGLRGQIAEESGDSEKAVTYNQLAWLIGNTEGDFDEALKYSQKSIELIPQTASFHDTLARVYYAKGDLENAVKYQSKALELEPHSGLMRRQLDFFRAALKKREES